MSAALLGYWAVYFEGEKGFAVAKIGLMMSMYVGAALIGQYFFGYLCDKLQSIRIPVSLAAVLFALLATAIPTLSDKVWIYPCMALVGFFQQPIGPMLDSWTLKHLSRHDQRTLFGKIRGFGSLGWATVALLTAYLIFYYSWNMMFIVSVLAGLLLSGLVLLIPDVGESNSGLTQEQSETPEHSGLTMQRALFHLFGNKAYLYILAVVFLMYLGVQTTFNFQGLLIKGTGGGVKELGWTYFFGVMSEMPAMFLSVWLLPKMAPRKLMLVAGGLYMLRYGLIIYFQTSWIIMLTACLEGVAFGVMLTALRNYVFSVVAEDVQTSAMTLVDAVFLALTVIVGGVAGGWIIDTYSAMHMLAACACSTGLAVVLLLGGKRFDKHHALAKANQST
jgi:PPP family 3-phenylpropionic acid transporter